MGWAGRHPQRVRGLVVLNSAAFPSNRLPWRIRICRWPLIGAVIVRGLNGFARAAVRMGVHKPMPKPVAQGFLAPYRSWKDRVAIHAFIRDIPMSPSHPSWDTLAEVEQNLERLKEKKMLICWGARDFCFTEHFYDEWRQRFPRAEAHLFADAGHYVLEDAFEEIAPLVQNFVSSCVCE
jgi:haloalkane dehalogenase